MEMDSSERLLGSGGTEVWREPHKRTLRSMMDHALFGENLSIVTMTHHALCTPPSVTFLPTSTTVCLPSAGFVPTSTAVQLQNAGSVPVVSLPRSLSLHRPDDLESTPLVSVLPF